MLGVFQVFFRTHIVHLTQILYDSNGSSLWSKVCSTFSKRSLTCWASKKSNDDLENKIKTFRLNEAIVLSLRTTHGKAVGAAQTMIDVAFDAITGLFHPNVDGWYVPHLTSVIAHHYLISRFIASRVPKKLYYIRASGFTIDVTDENNWTLEFWLLKWKTVPVSFIRSFQETIRWVCQ